jgi:hypothetical protein
MLNGTETRREVFLVSDLTTGLAILNSEEVSYTISNGFGNSCVAMNLTAAVYNTTYHYSRMIAILGTVIIVSVSEV